MSEGHLSAIRRCHTFWGLPLEWARQYHGTASQTLPAPQLAIRSPLVRRAGISCKMIPFVLDDFAKAIHHPIVLISTFGSVVLQLPSVTVISHHSCRIFRSARRLLHTGLDYIKRIPGEGVPRSACCIWRGNRSVKLHCENLDRQAKEVPSAHSTPRRDGRIPIDFTDSSNGSYESVIVKTQGGERTRQKAYRPRRTQRKESIPLSWTFR